MIIPQIYCLLQEGYDHRSHSWIVRSTASTFFRWDRDAYTALLERMGTYDVRSRRLYRIYTRNCSNESGCSGFIECVWIQSVVNKLPDPTVIHFVSFHHTSWFVLANIENARHSW
jgi:hypothetical protein